MKRREFITILGGAAVAWPLATLAQHVAVPVIGYLYAGSEVSQPLLAAFQKGLGESGYFENQNVAIEYRWANDVLDDLPKLAAELVRRRVAVIATPGSTQAALAAKAATTTIPIVFSTGVDPVQVGLVASLNRPGGNVTGVNYMQVELAAKQLGLLHELLPTAKRFTVVVNPNNPSVVRSAVVELEGAASSIGAQIDVLRVSSYAELDDALTNISQDRIQALLIAPGQFFGCGAKTRAGGTCMVRVELGKARCRFHGGLSTGPKTKIGRARIAEAQRRRWRTFRDARQGNVIKLPPWRDGIGYD
jgi:putative tryptophan/tyrosine transport system substrate-binding protein